MQRLAFDCTLLTDLVLSSSPASQGFHPSLDYLPGAKFLGVVAAQLYDMQAQADTLARFHHGGVRFGDAHPVAEDGRLSYRIPAAWQYDKNQGMKPPFYLAHRLDNQDEEGRKLRRVLVAKGIQLKQARHRYLLPGPQPDQADWLEVEQKFTIKSAYDRQKLRSKDQQMYGYFALPAGTVWRFLVEVDDPADAETIQTALLKATRMGRSSSSQYGRIRLEPCDPYDLDQQPEASAGEAYLYAFSNLCFYDEWGHATLQPSPRDLGLPEGSSIDWNRSQIRSRVYRTWNKKRNGPNADRLIIAKGSVFVVNLASAMSAQRLAAGVGAHRSEGLGRLLLNPSFLPPSTVFWSKPDRPIVCPQAASPITKMKRVSQYQVDPAQDRVPRGNATQAEAVIAFLRKRRGRQQDQQDLDEAVNRFVKDHRHTFAQISSSQWGQVRSLAKNIGDDPALLDDWLFGQKENQPAHGFLLTGLAKRVWDRGPNGPAAVLKVALQAQPPNQQKSFLLKLATQMAKAAQTA